MKITKNQIETLLGFVSKTHDDEISCQACEDQIAQFAESQLTGKEIPEALQAIEEHLRICPECSEELEFIRRALESDLQQD
jgi:uncharacterized protein with PIN domain